MVTSHQFISSSSVDSDVPNTDVPCHCSPKRSPVHVDRNNPVSAPYGSTSEALALSGGFVTKGGSSTWLHDAAHNSSAAWAEQQANSQQHLTLSHV